jgi:hypothetical protein
MQTEQPHVSNEVLLLSADGELPPDRNVLIHGHLEACWECRARLIEIQNTITEFVRIHHRQLNSQLPAIEGPRALLRAHLRQASALSKESVSSRSIRVRVGRMRQFLPTGLAVVTVGMMLAVLVVLQRGWRARENVADVNALNGAMPRSSLTPGEAAWTSSAEVCTADLPTERTLTPPASLKQSVFERYGLSGARAEDFEVDYLITPDLGGATTIRNLWPEPYYRTAWNAHVKDQLETRLKDLVCNGKLDLTTAQHDISADWIAAYKKYFGTASPVNIPKPLMVLIARADLPAAHFQVDRF